jgi:hypothetical protein
VPAAQTFTVGARLGRRVAGWPFGRLDVADDALGLRFRPAGRFSPRSAAKDTVVAVRVRRRHLRTFLDIEDSGGVFRDVGLEIPYGVGRLVGELRGRGYPVIDQR